MMLITKAIRDKLTRNWEIEDTMPIDPVCKLFTPDAQCTWLLIAMADDGEERALALCDLGMGFPELGYVSLPELRTLRGKLGLPVERDFYWKPSGTVSQYVNAARGAQHIVEPKEAS